MNPCIFLSVCNVGTHPFWLCGSYWIETHPQCSRTHTIINMHAHTYPHPHTHTHTRPTKCFFFTCCFLTILSVLRTTLGDLDVELWGKQVPKTCRNFIQLCLEQYYDNTIFHRVIKNFIAQGGDPLGTGEGNLICERRKRMNTNRT